MRIDVVDIPVPEGVNVIVGRAHFIKTVEDLYEALMSAVPGIKFGIGFCEASGKRLVRHEANDDELRALAIDACKRIGAGHAFVVYVRNAWPINLLAAIRSVPEVVEVLAATANPLKVIVAEVEPERRGIIGVVDGFSPLGVEGPEDVRERRALLREKLGYKL